MYCMCPSCFVLSHKACGQLTMNQPIQVNDLQHGTKRSVGKLNTRTGAFVGPTIEHYHFSLAMRRAL